MRIQKMEQFEIELQKVAGKMVQDHVIHCMSLTIDHHIKNDSDLWVVVIDLLEEYRTYHKNRMAPEDLDDDDWDETYGDEIYEYWAVSSWLYDRLKEHGEVVFEFYDFLVWGRQGTGQAILLDRVIREITMSSFYGDEIRNKPSLFLPYDSCPLSETYPFRT